DRTHTLGGRPFSPEELSGLVLRSLKADAEAMLGRPVTRAVITCPAYFNDRQRKATLAAGRIAGLTVERVLNEPTAAAIAYGFHEAGRDRKLLVFDLGGGTFDVSVVGAGAREVTVTRAELEAWVGPTLARVELPIRRALGDAKLSREGIDEVILVGGATRMPLVVRRVRELFGKEPHRRLNPDEVVA